MSVGQAGGKCLIEPLDLALLISLVSLTSGCRGANTMGPIKLLAALIALLLAATPVFAAEWVRTGESYNNAISYYDAETIRRFGKEVEVWIKEDHSRDKTVKYRETKTHLRYNCVLRTFTVYEHIEYSKNGEPLAWIVSADRQRPSKILPNSHGELMLKLLCQ
jgi:hypothetical protein